MEELIVLKQLPIIEERLELLKQEVLLKSEQLKSLTVCDETKQEIKKLKAEFNKQFKELDDKRKLIKAELDKPYLNFMNIFNEIKDIFKNTDNDLKLKIAEIEDGIKAERTQELKDYFDEVLLANDINFISYEYLDIKIGISGSLNKIKEYINTTIENIANDIKTINTMKDNEILVEYKKSFNLADAINIVAERRTALKELEDEPIIDTEMEDTVKEIVKEETPIVEECIQFKIWTSKDEVKLLIKYMEERGIKYE